MAGKNALNKVSGALNSIHFIFKNNHSKNCMKKPHTQKKTGSQFPESAEIYKKVIKLTKNMNRFINFIISKATAPCVIIPKYIACYYIYFTTDTGNDAFELLLPMW